MKVLLMGGLLLTGCAHHVRHAPVLTEPAVQSPAPEQKGVLSRTADATWNVVSAPVRLVTPGPKAPPKEQQVYEAPEAVIMTPSTINDTPPATQPR